MQQWNRPAAAASQYSARAICRHMQPIAHRTTFGRILFQTFISSVGHAACSRCCTCFHHTLRFRSFSGICTALEQYLYKAKAFKNLNLQAIQFDRHLPPTIMQYCAGLHIIYTWRSPHEPSVFFMLPRPHVPTIDGVESANP